MKKLSFIFLAILSAYACNAQPEPPKKTMALVHKLTATWCGPCGDWGWDAQKKVEEQNKKKALVLNIHTDGSDLFNPIMESLNKQFDKSFAVPNWYVQGRNETASDPSSGGIYGDLTIDRCKQLADSLYDEEPDISSSFDYNLNGSSLNVVTNTKFFNDVDDKYYLGVYLIEDDVLNEQAGASGELKHQGIIREIINGSNHFGEEVSESGTTSAGTMVTNNYEFEIPSEYNQSKLYIALMMFKKDGSKYEIVNTYKSGSYLEETSGDLITAAKDSTYEEITLPSSNSDDEKKELTANFSLNADKSYMWKVEEVNMPSGWKLESVCDNILCWSYPENEAKSFIAEGSSSKDFLKLVFINDLSNGYGYVMTSLTSNTNPDDSKEYKFSLLIKGSSSIVSMGQLDKYELYFAENNLLKVDKKLNGETLKIYDMSGNIIVNEKINYETKDLHLSNGVYVIDVLNEHDGKMIKQLKIQVNNEN